MTEGPTWGVSAVVLKDHHVLLNMREDFEVWGLPGGRPEIGESLVEAARRETLEETGHTIEGECLLGVYSAVNGSHTAHAVTFRASASIGAAASVGTPDEVLAVAWFPVEDLPERFVWWHAGRIRDAASGGRSAVAVTTTLIRSRVCASTRSQLYAARDLSAMSRSDFFAWNFPKPDDLGLTERV